MQFSTDWPGGVAELIAAQLALAALTPPLWVPSDRPSVAGCFVCFARDIGGVCFARDIGGVCFARDVGGQGRIGEPAWAAAAVYRGRHCIASSQTVGRAGWPYLHGLLALRAGPLLESATRSLATRPDVLIVDATGLDHPRRAGLARHLGAVLDIPTVGVTHRPMLAVGDWPDAWRGATSSLRLDGELVGFWVRTRDGRRPVAVHAGWRTDPNVAAQIVLAASRRHRTPTPLREARRLARTARALDSENP